jgi:hypothetical protein
MVNPYFYTFGIYIPKQESRKHIRSTLQKQEKNKNITFLRTKNNSSGGISSIRLQSRQERLQIRLTLYG